MSLSSKKGKLGMARRTTVMIDDDLVKKLRERQAKLIKESINSVSFSKVLNEVIRKGLGK
jgi:uncharacterized hydantoinase/oxoprolinase family protein